MEIISYVGYAGRSYTDSRGSLGRRFGSWLSEKRKDRRGRKEARPFVSTGIVQVAREKAIAARPVRRTLTFQDFLTLLGRTVSLAEKNASALALSISSAAVVAGVLFGSAFFWNYTKDHTGRLPLAEVTSEVELLDSIMHSFAKEESVEYLSDGSLPDAEFGAGAAKLFSQPVTYRAYTVQSGDTISSITRKFGLKNISTIIGVNGIENVRLLVSGQKLKIPSIDGLVYSVQKENTLQGLSAKYKVSVEELLDVNELESANLTVGQKLFIPGARLSGDELLNAMGELFKCPLTSKFRYTSMFGPRPDPITGAKSFHTGVDMACPTGTPIYSSSTGTVAFVGYSNIFGNYIIVKHPNGYQTLYGHMSSTIAKKGQTVSQGTKLGLVGSTGYSTGSHLHFTVYKNGHLVDPMTVIKK